MTIGSDMDSTNGSTFLSFIKVCSIFPLIPPRKRLLIRSPRFQKTAQKTTQPSNTTVWRKKISLKKSTPLRVL